MFVLCPQNPVWREANSSFRSMIFVIRGHVACMYFAVFFFMRHYVSESVKLLGEHRHLQLPIKIRECVQCNRLTDAKCCFVYYFYWRGRVCSSYKNVAALNEWVFLSSHQLIFSASWLPPFPLPLLNNRDEEEGQSDDSVPDSRFLYGSVYMKKFYSEISIHSFPFCITRTRTARTHMVLYKVDSRFRAVVFLHIHIDNCTKHTVTHFRNYIQCTLG